MLQSYLAAVAALPHPKIWPCESSRAPLKCRVCPPCSRGDAAVAPLPAAGEPAPAGPDPQPDGQEGAAAAAQHGAGRAFSSTRSIQPGLHAYLCPDQLPVVHPRSESSADSPSARSGAHFYSGVI